MSASQAEGPAPEGTPDQLLAEIHERAARLRELALETGDHGLAVLAKVISDQAAAGVWGLGAVMDPDGFRPPRG